MKWKDKNETRNKRFNEKYKSNKYSEKNLLRMQINPNVY